MLTLHGQSNSQSWTGEWETVLIEWPVNERFRFRALLDLDCSGRFEEFLHLQREGLDYSVAWFANVRFRIRPGTR